MIGELGKSEGGETEEEKKSNVRATAATDESSSSGGTGEEEEKPKKIVASYEELVDSLDTTGLEESVAKAVEGFMSETAGEIDQIADYYSYVSYVFGAFAAIWLIQFLFAFFHIFAKNKRFCMWYTKLLCWIPCVIWLAITLLSNIQFLEFVAGFVDLGEVPLTMIAGAAGGIASFTGISGLCLILLWLISIFWAFPIKHKIRKTKKQIKRERKQYKRYA